MLDEVHMHADNVAECRTNTLASRLFAAGEQAERVGGWVLGVPDVGALNYGHISIFFKSVIVSIFSIISTLFIANIR